MAKNTGTLIIDESVSQKERENISEKVLNYLDKMKSEVSNREPILNKRMDFYEGRHQRWTNVVGLTNKQQEGHILAVFNYIFKFCYKLLQSLTNTPPRIKIKGTDESDEIEAARAEAVEQAIGKVFRDNNFFEVIFKRAAVNQIRDADFILDCRVMEDKESGRHIEITNTEDLLKVMVGWDDAAGTSFSFVAFRDMWTLPKIKRELGIDAQPFKDVQKDNQTTKGSHLNDQYGIFATSGSSANNVATGQTQLEKGEIIDWWGYEVIGGETKVVNLIYVNRELKQFIVTDYKKLTKFIGHSFITAGRPWSRSFIDDLVDPQVELNDRTSEEGDLIRVGSHMKFLAINMPDFDPDSVKPGSGQVIFIEGENADFKPLTMNFTPFPSEAYLNRVLDHLFNIGIPKIGLSAGTAPYTGRVGAIAYQPIIDLVTDLRVQWEVVLRDLVRTIQQYMIDYFPEFHPILREHISDPDTGESYDGDMIIREVEFDWDNILPLSRSDKVVDASTMRDRGTISLSTYLEQAGFKNPGEEIKKLKKESKDPELMVIRQQFATLSPGVIKAQEEARKSQLAGEEEMASQVGMMNQNQPTQKETPPILTSEQNSGRRGIMSAVGTPTGQTATPAGAVAQASQNLNAKAGV